MKMSPKSVASKPSRQMNGRVLIVAALLSFVVPAKALISVANGDFSNMTGLTFACCGEWYSGVPAGWTSTGSTNYSVNTSSAYGNPAPPVANLGSLGTLRQNVGMNTYNSVVTLTFDVGTFDTAPSVNVRITDGTNALSTLLAFTNVTTGTSHTLAAYVPANTPVYIEFVQVSAGSPWVDNVSVSSVPSALAFNNGNFSNLNGLNNLGGGWWGGLPVGWGGSSGVLSYSVNSSSGTTPPVANLNVLTNLTQTIGSLNYPANVTVSYLFEIPFGAASFSAQLLTNSSVAVSAYHSTPGAQSMTVSNVPAGVSIAVQFLNVSGAPALDDLSVSASYSPTAAPTITSQPPSKNAMIPGTVRTLSVGALGVAPLSYQWRSNGVAISGANAASFTVTKPGSYTVVVTGGNSLSVTSTVAQVIGTMVNGAFSDLTGLTNQNNNGWYSGLPSGWTCSSGPLPYAVNTAVGSTPPVANMNVLANLSQSVGTLTNASDVVLTFDFSHPPAWGGPSPEISALILTNSVVMVSNRFDYNSYGTKTVVATNAPAGASLTVMFVNETPGEAPALDNVGAVAYATGSPIPPQIIEQPTPFTLLAPGDNLNLSVFAIGLPTQSYQWRTNGVALGGQTSASLTLAGVTPGSSGNYTVVATGPGGSVTSAVAQVVVVSTPPVTIILDPMNATAGTFLNGTTPASRGGIGSSAWGAGANLVMDGTQLTETAASDSAFVPFSPDAGNIYTLSCQMDILSGNWIGLGYAQNSNPNNYSGFWTSSNNLQGWMCQVGTGDYYLFTGPELTASVGTPSVGPGFNYAHTNAMVLNTVGTNWTFQYFVDGVAVGGPAAYSVTPGVNPVINYVGIGNSDTNFNPAGQSATFKNFKLQSALPRIIPALGIQKSGSNATLSWNIAAGGWALESSASLSTPSWTVVPGVVNNSVTVPIGTGSLFFRLRSTY